MTDDDIRRLARLCNANFSELCFVFSMPELKHFVDLIHARMGVEISQVLKELNRD